MKRFFSSNLERKGRVFRGVMALGLGIGAWFAFGVSRLFGVVLIIATAFTLFEAARGWCVLRACGLKTRL
jgi:hypothetical protein